MGSGAPVRLWNWAIFSASEDIVKENQGVCSWMNVSLQKSLLSVRHHSVPNEILMRTWRPAPLRTSFRDDVGKILMNVFRNNDRGYGSGQQYRSFWRRQGQHILQDKAVCSLKLPLTKESSPSSLGEWSTTGSNYFHCVYYLRNDNSSRSIWISH